MKLQGAPPQNGEEDAFREISMKLGALFAKTQLRSAKAARLISEATGKLQSAREILQQESARPLAPPPDLGGGLPMAAPMGPGGPAGL